MHTNGTGQTPSDTSLCREQAIRVAAYFRAAGRDFAPGDAVQDWLAAEAEIDASLAVISERDCLATYLRCWIADWDGAVAGLRRLLGSAPAEYRDRVEARLAQLQLARDGAECALARLTGDDPPTGFAPDMNALARAGFPLRAEAGD